MATQIKNTPITTLRERGGLKATIWKNSSQRGDFYSIEFSRTYKSEDGYHDSKSFNESDLLVLAHLATKAHDHVSVLRKKDADSNSQE
ncbi:hypothetical protein [Stratiformator vulcanicus]|uniref:Uncharacterized protein n=1 Tax=Stratiformator vulcanicus TaxID=2527980 RepID=A0A517R1D2_9PLAN|nr:hypothetical protein [Stratiformator vulcanicus]QDT37686.1 hypothetical protein Pan189_20680 [Stratiformator vulcanicus]